MLINFRSRVVRTALLGGLLVSATPALMLASGAAGAAGAGAAVGAGGADTKPAESMSNTFGRRVRSDLDDTDPIQFLLRRDKQLTLSNAQKDSLKAMHKQLDEDEKLIFKELSRVLQDADRDATVSASGRAGPPPVSRDLIARLNEVQNGYTAKGRALLNPDHAKIADSLQTIYMAELKEKAGKQRGGRRGG
jgi:hypothetical protein